MPLLVLIKSENIEVNKDKNKEPIVTSLTNSHPSKLSHPSKMILVLFLPQQIKQQRRKVKNQ